MASTVMLTVENARTSKADHQRSRSVGAPAPPESVNHQEANTMSARVTAGIQRPQQEFHQHVSKPRATGDHEQVIKAVCENPRWW